MAFGFKLGLGLSQRGGGGAPFLVTITGLTGGEARIGDHASISYTTDPVSATETVKWSNSPNPADAATYGTGASPTDYTAGDEGSLWLHVTDGGDTVSRSAPIRYAPGTTGAALDLSFPEDSAIASTDLLQNWTTTNLTMTFVSISPSLPTGLSINSGGTMTGTPTDPFTDATFTLTMQDQYGRTYAATFTLEVTSAAFTVSLTGLTGGEAVIGDHATIGYTISPDNGTETVAWGTANDDSTYGTGANPTDYTAGDGGNLVLSVTDNAVTQYASAPIRYAAGSPSNIADGQTFTTGGPISPLDASATGADLTWTYSATGLPASLSINSSTGEITGTVDAAGSGTVTVTATDQYGRTVEDTFTYTASAPAYTALFTEDFTGYGSDTDWTTDVDIAKGYEAVTTHSATVIAADDVVELSKTGGDFGQAHFVFTGTIGNNQRAEGTYEGSAATNEYGGLVVRHATATGNGYGLIISDTQMFLAQTSGTSAPMLGSAFSITPFAGQRFQLDIYVAGNGDHILVGRVEETSGAGLTEAIVHNLGSSPTYTTGDPGVRAGWGGVGNTARWSYVEFGEFT